MSQGIVIPEKEVMVNCAPDIAKICEPLLRLGISFFSYTRVYPDGTRMNIGTNPLSAAYVHYETSTYEGFMAEVHAEQFHNKVIFVPSLPDDRAGPILRERFNIDNIMSLAYAGPRYTENYNFGTYTGCIDIVSVYLNNLAYLKRFTFYFKEKAAYIIEEFDKNRLQTPRITPGPMRIASGVLPTPLHDLMVSRFYLNDHSYLTKREVECLQALYAGHNLKEIANQLGISLRTVETHLKHVKEKLRCSHAPAMIARARELGILI